ncbi:MAG: hypothetical protein Q4D98_14715 [Planctomycetia bacterium]|nr:hypothetical protein [Planctomycetia bacterium]
MPKTLPSMRPWETCPECGKRRTVVCRFCGTRGDDFPLADPQTLVVPEKIHLSYDDGSEDGVIAGSPLYSSLGPSYGPTELKLENCTCGHNASEGTGEKGCDCHSHTPKTSLKLSDPLDRDPEVSEDDVYFPLAVLCPCCHEVLYPKFLNLCETCGHLFPDGQPDPDRIQKNPIDGNFVRMVLVFLGMILFLALATVGLLWP